MSTRTFVNANFLLHFFCQRSRIVVAVEEAFSKIKSFGNSILYSFFFSFFLSCNISLLVHTSSLLPWTDICLNHILETTVHGARSKGENGGAAFK